MLFDVLIPSLNLAIKVPRVLRRANIYSTNIRGRGKARNILAKLAAKNYLLYVDADVDFNDFVFNRYIFPSIKNSSVVAFEGENNILCSRVLGIPKQLLFDAGGFDESFDVGEDIELGYRLIQMGIKINKIPKNLITHKEHKRPSAILPYYFVKIRCALRYKRFELTFLSKRTSPIGLTVYFFGFFYYLFNNKRGDIK